jgi:hypothetical protein
MMTTVDIRTMSDSSLAAASSCPRTVAIDRAKETGGSELGFNGGELLLAICGCYINDSSREDGKRRISATNVQARVRAGWSGEPMRSQNLSFHVAVEAAASQQDILDLNQHTERAAEIPNSLRFGAQVKRVEFKAIPLR